MAVQLHHLSYSFWKNTNLLGNVQSLYPVNVLLPINILTTMLYLVAGIVHKTDNLFAGSINILAIQPNIIPLNSAMS
jgi:hypothetical protein